MEMTENRVPHNQHVPNPHWVEILSQLFPAAKETIPSCLSSIGLVKCPSSLIFRHFLAKDTAKY